ncbi:hypothetical protein ACFV2X_23115 [Streptomyces sp. NPDC059679]|uniref:hypothetical protein n=1 Tax=Streptomyces sp. NPDC059679 TaxID=3346903 RepID=UPI0036B7EA61
MTTDIDWNLTRTFAGTSGDHQVFVWVMPGYGTSEMAMGQDVSLAAQGRVFTELLSHWA